MYKTFNRILLSFVFLSVFACQNHEKIKTSNYSLDFENLMLQIVPFVAKLHDSISEENRLNKGNNAFIESHIIERKYQWLNFYIDSSKTYYFQISRLEPSIKNDKFSAICGSFNMLDEKTIDKNTFKEIYWTWKMREKELDKKSEILFKDCIHKKSLEKYKYPKANEDWIEFPSDKVIYNEKTQSWMAK